MAQTIKITKEQLEMLVEENKKGSLLNERTSSIIYHWASPETAYSIVSEDRFSLMSILFKNAETYVLGASHNRMYYLSLTRNGKIGMGGYSNNEHPWVRFTLDGDMLNSKFHTKAIDYWGSSMGKNSRYVRHKEDGYTLKPGSETESEDRLYSNKSIINNAKSYIKHIDIYIDLNNLKDYEVKLLEPIYNIVLRAKNICSIYTSIKDFNSSKNPLPFEEFTKFVENYQINDNIKIRSKERSNIDTKLLASICFLVNFPNGSFDDCMRTLNQYGLGKYSKKVADIIKNYPGWGNPFVFNSTNFQWKKESLIRTLEEHYQNIRMGNSLQKQNRDDLDKAFKILTDFCKKNKLSNYEQMTAYFWGFFDEDLGDDYQQSISLTCATLEGDDELCVCVNPSVCKYKDVFRYGKDNLENVYSDIIYRIDNHKSSSYEKFQRYLKRYLMLGNPTVQDVIDLYDKLEVLGNNIDTSCKPHICEKEFGLWAIQNLLDKEPFVQGRTRGETVDGETAQLFDLSQQKMIKVLWKNKK